MNIIHIVGLILIAVCAVRGYKKGFIDTVGSILASLLSIVFVYLLNAWAFESVIPHLLSDYMIVVVRILLCVLVYSAFFFLLKAILMSLKILSRFPVFRGLNKLLGFIAGGCYGLLLAGIIYWVYGLFLQ